MTPFNSSAIERAAIGLWGAFEDLSWPTAENCWKTGAGLGDDPEAERQHFRRYVLGALQAAISPELQELMEAAVAYSWAWEAFFDKPNDKRREEGPALQTAKNHLLSAAVEFGDDAALAFAKAVRG